MKRLGVIELVPDTSGFLGKHDIFGESIIVHVLDLDPIHSHHVEQHLFFLVCREDPTSLLSGKRRPTRLSCFWPALLVFPVFKAFKCLFPNWNLDFRVSILSLDCKG